eukprot:scaffold5557_cov129-Isochrysis_galbana.AAC.1
MAMRIDSQSSRRNRKLEGLPTNPDTPYLYLTLHDHIHGPTGGGGVPNAHRPDSDIKSHIQLHQPRVRALQSLVVGGRC